MGGARHSANDFSGPIDSSSKLSSITRSLAARQEPYRRRVNAPYPPSPLERDRNNGGDRRIKRRRLAIPSGTSAGTPRRTIFDCSRRWVNFRDGRATAVVHESELTARRERVALLSSPSASFLRSPARPLGPRANRAARGTLFFSCQPTDQRSGQTGIAGAIAAQPANSHFSGRDRHFSRVAVVARRSA